MPSSDTVRRKRVFTLLLIAILPGYLLSGCGGSKGTKGSTASQATAVSDDIVVVARELVDSMVAGDFTGAEEHFDRTMRQELPPALLRQSWESVLSESGAFQKVKRSKKKKAGEYDVVSVTCVFSRGSQDVEVYFSEGGDVTGLFFKPSSYSPAYRTPDYVDTDSFTEKSVTVRTGRYELPGTLSIPKGGGPFPAVVLVHGSGPNDRDETIGPNKPFRDLARGLASQGIAVLRYEKRTREYMTEYSFDDYTVKEETIDDAISAVTLLRRTASIDPDKVFLLGHSLGAQLIPRIAGLDPEIRGFIALSGPNWPLEDSILQQSEYLASLDGTTTEEEKAALDEQRAQVARVKSPGLSENTPASELPLNIPASYWLDLRGYDPAEVAKGIGRPFLILQGERDYQVPMAEFQRLKDMLASKSNVSTKVYHKLNHLFMEGEGRSTPEEYDKASNIPRYVVGDIAEFIKSN